MKKSHLGFAAIVVLLLIVASNFIHLPGPEIPQSPTDAPVFSHDKLTLRRADGQTFPFDIEMATTPKEAMYGLMFRRSIEPQTGMLFLWDPDHQVSMWMKNTYIPLDMLFIRRDGTIEKIVTHAVPLDLTPIPSEEPIHGILEIKAGEVERLGLKTEDKVLFWAFSTAP